MSTEPEPLLETPDSPDEPSEPSLSAEPVQEVPGPDSPDGPTERRYRAIHGFAVASLILGGLSILSLLHVLLGLIPIAGITFAWLALKRIRRNPEEIAGIGFARWGMRLSMGFWLIGSGWLIYQYYTEAPAGYKPVAYKTLQPPPDEKEFRIPTQAEDLDKQQIFVHGYMFRARQQTGITEFVLVDDRGACSFCAPKPKVTQLIRVKLKNGLKADFTTYPIGVGGEFTVHKNPNEKGMGGLIYMIEADILR
jgi:hypothetical protein